MLSTHGSFDRSIERFEATKLHLEAFFNLSDGTSLEPFSDMMVSTFLFLVERICSCSEASFKQSVELSESTEAVSSSYLALDADSSLSLYLMLASWLSNFKIFYLCLELVLFSRASSIISLMVLNWSSG